MTRPHTSDSVGRLQARQHPLKALALELAREAAAEFLAAHADPEGVRGVEGGERLQDAVLRRLDGVGVDHVRTVERDQHFLLDQPVHQRPHLLQRHAEPLRHRRGRRRPQAAPLDCLGDQFLRRALFLHRQVRQDLGVEAAVIEGTTGCAQESFLAVGIGEPPQGTQVDRRQRLHALCNPFAQPCKLGKAFEEDLVDPSAGGDRFPPGKPKGSRRNIRGKKRSL